MKKLALVAVVVVVGALGWRALRSDAPDTRLVFDRFWVDHLPRDQRDQFLTFYMQSRNPFGLFDTRTPWKGQWEGFHYHVVPRGDATFDLLFPGSNQRERVTLRARRCDEKGFDFCLDVSGSSRGARRYYSRSEWQVVDGNTDAVQAKIVDGLPE